MRFTAAVVSIVLTVAGAAACSGDPEPVEVSETSAPRPTEAPSSSGAAPAGAAKEGWFGIGGALHARVEMKGVERRSDRSVLHFTVTSLDPEPVATGNAFGHALGDSGTFNIPLVDPVGRKVYQPLKTSSGGTLGSEPGRYLPGVVYASAVYYPPIPASVPTVTALTSGTTGEFTGIQVGVPAPEPAPPVSGSPAAGSVVSWPLREGDAEPVVQSLYDITEGEIEETTSSGVEEKVGLRTDVLFGFNSADLSGKAKAVLDKVADETRGKADPAQPITVTGHTDSKGDNPYNLKLSLRRAQAVEKELKARLGGDYRFQSAGRGETQPVATEGGSDDELARSRNRRVDIAYQINQQAPEATVTTTASAQVGGVGAPAPFSADDGEVVASRYARYGKQKRRIDVHPFYRDGAYLVAVFDIVSEGPGGLPPTAGYGDLDYAGGDFTAFAVIDPKTQDVYRAVRMGPKPKGVQNYVEPGWATFRLKEGEPNRGFFYVPAPPDDVKIVTFDGGPFGKVLEVPIR